MEKNKINETILFSDDKYNEFISKTIAKLKKNKDIKISGKILYYLDKPVLYYYCIVFSNTKSNPFDIDIAFSFEFIDGEIPYVRILTDFIDPTLNDNRNYFRCLLEEHTYKFMLNNLSKCENILLTMVEGIENFLTYINESLAINSFVFFGEYESGHIYQINDFLQGSNYLNFYRINEIKNNKYEEKYIIFTKLYFLLFSPTPNDKALVKLLFCQKLKELNLFFDKNENNNSIILSLKNKKKNINLEFTIIDRNRKENFKDLNLVSEEDNNIINDKDKKSDFSIVIKEWFSYLDKIDFKTFDIVLHKYKIFFKDNKRELKFHEKNENKLKEYNNYILFNEKLISLYQTINSNGNNARIHKLVSNIIYICSELVDYGEPYNGKENEYLVKIRKYIKLKIN